MDVRAAPARFLELERHSRRRKRDHVAVVEASYVLDVDDSDWMEGVVRATEPLLNQGLGVIGYFWRAEANGTLLVLEEPTCLSSPAELPLPLTRAASLMSPSPLLAFQTGGPCHSHSEVRGKGFLDAPEMREALIPMLGACDMINVRATHADLTSGVAIGACARNLTTVSPRMRAAFERVAAHVAAGGRLRFSLRATRAKEQPAEAVFYSGAGHSNELIAYELGLAPSTVSELLKNALRKLRLRSRSDLVQLFASAGALEE